jgi:hypothetical protein
MRTVQFVGKKEIVNSAVPAGQVFRPRQGGAATGQFRGEVSPDGLLERRPWHGE